MLRIFINDVRLLSNEFMPRNVELDRGMNKGQISLYMAGGTRLYIYLLGSCHLLVAVCVAVGLSTRVVGPLLWLLQMSIVVRSLSINNGADFALLQLLLWSCLLPSRTEEATNATPAASAPSTSTAPATSTTSSTSTTSTTSTTSATTTASWSVAHGISWHLPADSDDLLYGRIGQNGIQVYEWHIFGSRPWISGISGTQSSSSAAPAGSTNTNTSSTTTTDAVALSLCIDRWLTLPAFALRALFLSRPWQPDRRLNTPEKKIESCAN
jgi:hypothetical protein